MHEYLVKWENRSLEQNTWEPAPYLDDVPHLLEIFERQLARQKETRAAIQAKQAAAANQGVANKPGDVNKVIDAVRKDGISPGALKTLPTSSTPLTLDTNKAQLASPSERPQRTSKTKAMDQVKQWVAGSASSAANSPNSELNQHNENERDWPMNTSTGSNHQSQGVKRKLEDSDFNDSNASDLPATTTATMEDLEEDLIPSHTLKRMKYGNSVSVEVKTKMENVSFFC